MNCFSVSKWLIVASFAVTCVGCHKPEGTKSSDNKGVNVDQVNAPAQELPVKREGKDAVSTGAGTVTTPPKEGEINLRFNFDKGQHFVYLTHATILQDLSGKKTTVDTSTSMVIDVVSKSDNEFKTTMMIKEFSMNLPKNTPDQEKKMMESMVSSVKGTTVDATYDNRGNSKETVVQSKNDMVKMLLGAMNGSNTGFLGLICPEKPVSVGSTWESLVDMGKITGQPGIKDKTTGRSQTPIKFKLTKIEKKNGKTIASIHFEMVSNLEIDTKNAQGGGKAFIQSNTSGTLHVDAGKCILLDLSQDSTTTTKTAKVVMKQSQKNTIKLKS